MEQRACAVDDLHPISMLNDYESTVNADRAPKLDSLRALHLMLAAAAIVCDTPNQRRSIMASLPRVIRTLQPFDGRDEATLAQHARLLREAGLIPGGKRGVGAPHMTNRHAAVLLLGIYGSATPKDSVSTVQALGKLRHHFTGGQFEGRFEWLAQNDFLDGLSILIERVPEITDLVCEIFEADGRFNEEQIAILQKQAEAGGGLIDFKIEIGAASGTILMNWGETELLKVVYMVDVDRFMLGEYNDRLNADRQVTIAFSLRTIIALHNVIFGD